MAVIYRHPLPTTSLHLTGVIKEVPLCSSGIGKTAKSVTLRFCDWHRSSFIGWWTEKSFDDSWANIYCHVYGKTISLMNIREYSLGNKCKQGVFLLIEKLNGNFHAMLLLKAALNLFRSGANCDHCEKIISICPRSYYDFLLSAYLLGCARHQYLTRIVKRRRNGQPPKSQYAFITVLTWGTRRGEFGHSCSCKTKIMTIGTGSWWKNTNHQWFASFLLLKSLLSWQQTTGVAPQASEPKAIAIVARQVPACNAGGTTEGCLTFWKFTMVHGFRSASAAWCSSKNGKLLRELLVQGMIMKTSCDTLHWNGNSQAASGQSG